MGIVFGWIILSFIIGIVGSNRKIGFLSALFISLIFSPLIGLIFTLISKTDVEEKYIKSVLETQRSQQESLKELVSSKPNKNISLADEIEKLERLKNKNLITEEEFLKLKKRIIESNDNEELDKNTNNLENKDTINQIIKTLPNNIVSKSEDNKKFLSILTAAIVILLLFIGISYYNSKIEEEQNSNSILDEVIDSTPNESIQNSKPDIVKLKNFTYEDIARYGIASSMYEPINIVKSRKKADYYYVYYVRPSDSKYFDFKVKFDGNRVIYGDVNGRWQDTELDEKITFEEIGDKVNIMGAGETVQYKKGD
jgi:hypothetical protein